MIMDLTQKCRNIRDITIQILIRVYYDIFYVSILSSFYFLWELLYVSYIIVRVLLIPCIKMLPFSLNSTIKFLALLDIDIIFKYFN